MWTLTFILALPFSIWMLANLLAIFDRTPRSPNLLRLGLGASGLFAFLILTNRSLWVPVAVAFALVLLIHTLFGWLFRHHLLGTDVVYTEALETHESASLHTEDDADDDAQVGGE